MPLNRAEEFVLNVCRRSFLRLWCYNNPKGKDGDELCDVLVVCDPDVIVLSVKEIKLAENPTDTHFERWRRKAVEASASQIYGAERWLASASHVIRSDGSEGFALPPLDRRKVHRIAVAFGSRGEIGVGSGDFGKGYVHVMTEETFQDILNELDTVSDMVKYLGDKEAFSGRSASIMYGTEKDLLGWYLFQGRTFPEEADLMIISDDVWDGLRGKPEYRQRKDADKKSYAWDKLIEMLSDPASERVSEAGTELSSFEVALRTMSRENRLSRRILGSSLRGFLENAKANKARSRIMFSTTGSVLYVIVYFRSTEADDVRISELTARCVIARSKAGRGDSVVGIGIGEYAVNIGSKMDLMFVDTSRWTSMNEQRAIRLQSKLGYYEKWSVQHAHADEYPHFEID